MKKEKYKIIKVCKKSGKKEVVIPPTSLIDAIVAKKHLGCNFPNNNYILERIMT